MEVTSASRYIILEQMGADSTIAPKGWRGRFFEDFAVGDLYRSRFGRTVTESDNLLVTCLTINTNPMHFDAPFAESTRFGRILVNSTLTLALVTGLTVSDTSENAAANLEWTDIKLPAPVFIGDTLWAESEILEARESRSNPDVGIVRMRTRGVNQRGEVVIEFRRAFMVYRRGAPQAGARFPEPATEWSV
jgi:itaconyl-CoA hydratase